MILKIEDLSNGPRNISLTLDSGWTGTRPRDERIEGLEGLLKVKMSVRVEGDRVVVEGRLSGKIRVRCDRCLEPYAFELPPEFRLFLSPPVEDPDGEDIELREEDMAVGFVPGDSLDADNILMEQIHLALPMKSLCSEGCRGLCPRCGENLNNRRCDCLDEEINPAFMELRKLKIDGKDI